MQDRAELLADNAPHILVVDDDQKIRALLGRFLKSNGFRVTEAQDAAAARSFMRGLSFDLVLLDVMMPGECGLTLARDLKATRPVPICMLTALADAEDRISGLEAGVDDYVSKPFEPRELLLRLRNILRRGQTPTATRDEIRMGGCVFNTTRGELRRDDDTIKLTERERDLLRLFAQRIGVAVPRHELSSDDSTGSERAIDVQINRLRRKIEADQILVGFQRIDIGNRKIGGSCPCDGKALLGIDFPDPQPVKAVPLQTRFVSAARRVRDHGHPKNGLETVIIGERLRGKTRKLPPRHVTRSHESAQGLQRIDVPLKRFCNDGAEINGVSLETLPFKALKMRARENEKGNGDCRPQNPDQGDGHEFRPRTQQISELDRQRNLPSERYLDLAHEIGPIRFLIG